MTTNEIISILRSNCARLTQIVDNREMQKIYEATDEAINIINKAMGKQESGMAYNYLIVWVAPKGDAGSVIGNIILPEFDHKINVQDFKNVVDNLTNENGLAVRPSILNIIELANGGDASAGLEE